MFETSELTKEFEYQVYHRLGLKIKCDVNIEETDDLDYLLTKVIYYMLLLKQSLKPNRNIYSYDW
jgi:hypothetical protein